MGVYRAILIVPQHRDETAANMKEIRLPSGPIARFSYYIETHLFQQPAVASLQSSVNVDDCRLLTGDCRFRNTATTNIYKPSK
jgi:hypothetical protein